MPRASRITVSFPAPLLAFVDDYASRHAPSRSEVIGQAVKAFQDAELALAYRAAGEEPQNDWAGRALGVRARDDGRDMTQELLDERRAEAQVEGWRVAPAPIQGVPDVYTVYTDEEVSP